MMRSYGMIFLVALLVAAGVCVGADPTGYRDFVAPDAAQSDLKGTVRLVTSQTFKDTQNSGRKLSVEASTLYDQGGYILEERSVSLLGGGKSKLLKRVYEGSGNLIREEETEKGQLVKKKVRLSPEQRTVFWYAESDDSEGGLLEQMTYDRFGKQAEMRKYDAKGNVTRQYAAKRNEEGKEIEAVISDGNGVPELFVKITWDERGFIAASEDELKIKKIVVRTINDYPEVDSQGNWLRQTITRDFYEGARKTFSTKDIVVRTIEYY